MKRNISIILAAVMFLMLFTGCTSASAEAGTQAEPQLTENKSGKMLSESFPGSFSGRWSGADDCLFVNADAKVLVPETDTMPIATVQRRNFTQEEVDRVLEIFLDGGTLYKELGMTKPQVQERLDEYYAMQRGEIPLSLDGDKTMDDLPEIIERWEGYLLEAPEEGERIPAETLFQPQEYRGEVVEGFGELDGSIIHFHAINYPEFENVILMYQESFGDMNGGLAYPLSDYREPLENGMSENAARDAADKLLVELGIDNVLCDHVQEVFYVSNGSEKASGTGFKLEYVRNIDNVPLTYTPENGFSAVENSPFDDIWAYERITVWLCDGKVVSFRWANPYTEPVLENTSAELLPFEDIADIFAKMIIVTNDDIREINRKNGFDIIHTMDVDTAELGLMRVRDREDHTIGEIIPVWDFWAKTRAAAAEKKDAHLVYDGEYYEIVLTINALDGTILDRSLGY